MLDGIDPLYNPDIPVEDFLVVIVLSLDDFVANLPAPSKSLDAGLASSDWVEYLL